MNTDELYAKYARVLNCVAEDGVLAIAAVRLALRLALEEQVEQIDNRPRHTDDAVLSLKLLGEWLDENLAAAPYVGDTSERAKDAIREYQDRLIAETGANIALQQQLTNLQVELENRRIEYELLLAQYNSFLAAAPVAKIPTGNGKAADPDDDVFATVASLRKPSDLAAIKDDLVHNRQFFNKLPRDIRLQLVQETLAKLNIDSPTIEIFNVNKPRWMPPGRALTQSFKVPFAELATLHTEAA